MCTVMYDGPFKLRMPEVRPLRHNRKSSPFMHIILHTGTVLWFESLGVHKRPSNHIIICHVLASNVNGHLPYMYGITDSAERTNVSLYLATFDSKFAVDDATQYQLYAFAKRPKFAVARSPLDSMPRTRSRTCKYVEFTGKMFEKFDKSLNR